MLALVAVIGGLAVSALAQGIDTTKIKKNPHFTSLSDVQFIVQTDLYKDVPQHDHFLSYEVRLPKSWKRATGERLTHAGSTTKNLSDLVLGKVGDYYGPLVDGVSGHFEVDALALDYDISTRNWFLNYIISNGYTLEGMEEISKSRVEAVYVQLQGDTSYIVRTIAQINGSRMVLASYYLPEQSWNDEKAMQEKAVNSFQFTDAEPPRVENNLSYAFLDVLRFDYPSSWRLQTDDISTSEDMNAHVINVKDDKNQFGQIDLHIISTDVDTTLASQVQELRTNLKNTGLDIGNLIEVPTDYKPAPQVYFNRVEVYEASSKVGQYADQEFWLAIMVEDRYYYIVSMLTPSRNNSFMTWARNTEAFRTVVSTLRP